MRSGLLLFAKSEAAKKFLQENWESTEKHYLAIVHGQLAVKEGTLSSYLAETVPAGRFGNEAETSAGIVFLLSPAASFISGTVLRIDGARPQVRMGWGQVAAPPRPSLKPSLMYSRASSKLPAKAWMMPARSGQIRLSVAITAAKGMARSTAKPPTKVPATMELLGDANWWLPRWLACLEVARCRELFHVCSCVSKR